MSKRNCLAAMWGRGEPCHALFKMDPQALVPCTWRCKVADLTTHLPSFWNATQPLWLDGSHVSNETQGLGNASGWSAVDSIYQDDAKLAGVQLYITNFSDP